jgi:CCR4-NOT transcription complex subunit 4
VVLKSITEALDDYKIEDRTLKVSYGTTKYCSHFTKNQDCPNIMECYYLHEWDVKNQIIVSEENSKQVLYNEQMKIALENIRDNAELILKRKKDCSAKT